METNYQLFDPIDHESVSDAVVDQIENLIVSGVLKEGRRLPPEREMAELLGVSRPKLREALKALESRQLIRVHHGEGTFVAELVGKALSPALIDLYARHSDAFMDYLEYRQEQEAFAARLAAERATSADLEIIESTVVEMSTALESGDHEKEMDLDIRFHSAIVDASHNSTLIHMMGSIYDLTRNGVFYNRKVLRSVNETDKLLLAQHRAIANAIIKRDPQGAAHAAKVHIEFVGQTFENSKKEIQREKYAAKRLSLMEKGSSTV